jgi:DNA-binding NarL/FixJ family response regulator
VLEASNAREALNQLKENEFDLVVLDLDMPGMNGIDMLKEIKRQHKNVSVLVLSVYPEEQVAVRVLKAGSSGFVSKEAAAEQLVSAIRRILAGGRHISERVADLLLTHLKDSNDGPVHEKLSDREFQILCLFGEGKTTKEIAAALCLSSPTVSTYRARILNKMEMKTTAELVRYAIEHDISKPR